MIDPTVNDNWREESDATWGDRPGIVSSLLRYPVLVVAATLLGAAAGYALAQRAPVRYEADAVLILSDPGGPTVIGGGSTLSDSDRKVYLARQVELMKSTDVLERAQKLLGSGASLEDLRGAVEVHSSADMATVSIAATTADPRTAAAVPNAVATAYEQVMAEREAAVAQRAMVGFEKLRQSAQAELDTIPKSPDGQQTSHQQRLIGQIADLLQREQDVTAHLEVYDSGVENFERAEPPAFPSQPKPELAAMLGGLLGLLVAGALAWRAAARDRRAEGRGDPARILEAPLLGEVRRLEATKADKAQRVTPLRSDPDLEDAYHVIVASLEHELAGVSGRSIALTSARMGETKTSTALRIANAASHQNRKVLLIDADVRMQRLSKLVDAAQDASWRGSQKLPVPSGNATGAQDYIDRLVWTDSGMVLPVASGPTDAWWGNRATDVRHAVRSIGEMFDLVLIDTPPLLASSHALGVAGEADGVVLVVSHRIPLSHLRDVHDRLAFVKSPLFGYVYVRPGRRRFGELWDRVMRALRRTRAGRG